tara:strand:+ start:295 stop:582 length:288 start_codon:yes stop_codon:yes gene_type:complete
MLSAVVLKSKYKDIDKFKIEQDIIIKLKKNNPKKVKLKSFDVSSPSLIKPVIKIKCNKYNKLSGFNVLIENMHVNSNKTERTEWLIDSFLVQKSK